MEIEYISHTRLFFCLLGPFTYHVAIFEKSWKKLEGRTGFFEYLKVAFIIVLPILTTKKLVPSLKKLGR